jgi:nucleoid-associated protein YgaU
MASADEHAARPPAPGAAIDMGQTAGTARSRTGAVPLQPRDDAAERDHAMANIPPTATPQEYVISEGDTLSKIARRLYGRAEWYPLLYEANHDVLPDPDNLPVGQKIRIPEPNRPTLPAAEPKTESVGVYEVRENDTLMRIARRVYRDESMYRAIFEANSDKLTSERDLKPGMVLRLP